MYKIHKAIKYFETAWMSTIALRAWLCYSVSKCYTEGLDGYAVGLGIPLMLRLHRQQLLIHYISMTTPRHPLFLSRLCPPFAIRFFLLKSSLITTAPITDCTQDRKTSLRYKMIIIVTFRGAPFIPATFDWPCGNALRNQNGGRTRKGGACLCVCVCEISPLCWSSLNVRINP